jgi:hypothetical protein
MQVHINDTEGSLKMNQFKASGPIVARQVSKDPSFSRYARSPLTFALAMLSVTHPLPAFAQVSSTNSDVTLTAINTGNITVNGDIYNPVINGGENNSITITAEGARIIFDSKSLLKSISADPGMPVDAVGYSYSIRNDGIVSSNGILAGTKPFKDSADNVTVSAVGLQGGVIINAAPKK